MDAEQARSLLRKLPHSVETMQWGANLVYWVGDKAFGGKMFALINLDEDRDPLKPTPVLSFYVGPERFSELLETEGIVPAPYMARIYWVALTRWNALPPSELTDLLRDASEGVRARLPKKVLAVLALPQAERDKLVEERRRVLASREAAKPKSPKSMNAAAKKKPAKKASIRSRSD
jgi:predicted DNA-binding protein (MmcQ/YjbR family)